MADRPILFSAPMIRALLDGTKTQTRRTLKPLPNRTIFFDVGKAGLNQFQSPRISVGDRLYVREHWRTAPEHDGTAPRDFASRVPLCFLAGTGLTFPNPLWGKHRQAMHMPRWASRLTLTVTDVRVERLNDISREDAVAEGLIKVDQAPPMAVEMGCDWGFEGDDRYGSPISAYAALWDHINGAGAWEANPWVVAYTFTVHHRNIDQMATEAA